MKLTSILKNEIKCNRDIGMDRYCLVKLSIIYSYLYVEVGVIVLHVFLTTDHRQIKDGEITVLDCPLYSVSKYYFYCCGTINTVHVHK